MLKLCCHMQCQLFLPVGHVYILFAARLSCHCHMMGVVTERQPGILMHLLLRVNVD
jgi:hypothetical protein